MSTVLIQLIIRVPESGDLQSPLLSPFVLLCFSSLFVSWLSLPSVQYESVLLQGVADRLGPASSPPEHSCAQSIKPVFIVSPALLSVVPCQYFLFLSAACIPDLCVSLYAQVSHPHLLSPMPCRFALTKNLDLSPLILSYSELILYS